MEKNLSKSNLLACRPFETCVDSPNFSTAHLVGASRRQLVSPKKGNIFLLIPWDLGIRNHIPACQSPPKKPSFLVYIYIDVYRDPYIQTFICHWHPEKIPTGTRKVNGLLLALRFFFQAPTFIFWWEVVGPDYIPSVPLPWASVLNHFCSEKIHQMISQLKKKRGAQEYVDYVPVFGCSFSFDEP